ncbi:MAG TPA: JAB domain-containing protein, partial [Phycisphaerales bacterium]|nr:JAB domain-containing protein [Phycisphaerales bacterium]
MNADDIFADLAPGKRNSAGTGPSPADALFADLSPGASTHPGSNTADALFEDLRPPKPTRNTSLLQDLGTDVKRGVQQIPGMAAGLLDIPVAAATGERHVSQATDRIGEVTGFQPGKWAEEAEREYSPQRRRAVEEIDKAWEDGDAADIAGAYARNPGRVAGMVAESLPSMVAGGLGGRAALSGARAAGMLSKPATASQAARQGAAAAAGGEGAVIAGQTMQEIDESVDARRAALASAGAGVVGAGIGYAGGRLAQRAGLIDPDVLIAGGTAGTASPAPGLVKRMLGGALTEGVFEELPQTVQETMWQNWAEGRPLMENVPRAAVEGALAGGVLGAGVNIPGITATPRRNAAPPEMADIGPTPSEALGIDPAAGPISRAAATAVDQIPMPIDDPVAVGVIPDVEPTPDFGPFTTAVEGQFPVPLEAAQRLAALMTEHGRNPVIVPNIDETGFGVAHAQSLAPEQRAALARFQPAPEPEAKPWDASQQAPLYPFTQTGAERIAHARSERDGIGHVVIPHPTKADRFTVVRPDSPEAAAALPAQSSVPDQSTAPLDHGILNLKGRTDTIDAELDAFRKQQKRTTKAQTKAESAQRKADRAQAKDLFERHGERIVERHGARFGHKELRAELKRMATWQPRRFIDLVSHFRSETESGQVKHVQKTGKPFAVSRADGSTFGEYSNRRDAEGALERAGTGARIIDTTAQPADTRPQETQRDEQADPYDGIETRPGTTEAQRETGRSALQAIVRRLNLRAARRWGDHTDRAAITLLGARLTAGFRANGGNRLVGQKVDGAEALATLAQVYRDPRFETFRVFYTKGDTVVGEAGYSNRLPAAVYVPPNLTQDIERDLKGFEADGYFILHNHPSGRSRPSGADIKLTREVAQLVPGMRA